MSPRCAILDLSEETLSVFLRRIVTYKSNTKPLELVLKPRHYRQTRAMFPQTRRKKNCR